MSTKERIKSVFIGVLIVGVVYLTYSVWFYNSPFGELSLGKMFNLSQDEVISETSGDDTDLNRFGIRPMSIVIRDDAGARGTIYKSADTDRIYNKLRDGLKKAITGAANATYADESEWSTALKNRGVLCDYFGNLPISAVAKWMSGEYRDELSENGRYLLFSARDKNVVLYVKNAATGKISKHETSLPSQDLLSVMGTITAQKTTLASEREEEDFRVVAPEVLIVEGRETPFALSAYNPLSTFAQDITASVLARFKLSGGSPNTYSEQDGTQVYVADMITLKMSPNGVVSYSDTRDEIDDTLGIGIDAEGETPTVAEATEGARSLVESIAAALPGSGGIYITEVAQSDTGYEIVLGRHVGGIPVEMANTAFFARVTTRRKSISSAVINIRSFDVGSTISDTMGERLAAAAMKGSGQSGELSLRYADTGSGTVFTAWYTGRSDAPSSEEGSDGLVES